jgi:hypothetical protein
MGGCRTGVEGGVSLGSGISSSLTAHRRPPSKWSIDGNEADEIILSTAGAITTLERSLADEDADMGDELDGDVDSPQAFASSGRGRVRLRRRRQRRAVPAGRRHDATSPRRPHLITGTSGGSDPGAGDWLNTRGMVLNTRGWVPDCSRTARG